MAALATAARPAALAGGAAPRLPPRPRPALARPALARNSHSAPLCSVQLGCSPIGKACRASAAAAAAAGQPGVQTDEPGFAAALETADVEAGELPKVRSCAAKPSCSCLSALCVRPGDLHQMPPTPPAPNAGWFFQCRPPVLRLLLRLCGHGLHVSNPLATGGTGMGGDWLCGSLHPRQQ